MLHIFACVTYLSHVIKGIFPEQYDSSLYSQAIQSYSGRKAAECMDSFLLCVNELKINEMINEWC